MKVLDTALFHLFPRRIPSYISTESNASSTSQNYVAQILLIHLLLWVSSRCSLSRSYIKTLVNLSGGKGEGGGVGFKVGFFCLFDGGFCLGCGFVVVVGGFFLIGTPGFLKHRNISKTYNMFLSFLLQLCLENCLITEPSFTYLLVK